MDELIKNNPKFGIIYNIRVCVPHLFYSIDNPQPEPEATVEDSIPSNSSSICLNIDVPPVNPQDSKKRQKPRPCICWKVEGNTVVVLPLATFECQNVSEIIRHGRSLIAGVSNNTVIRHLMPINHFEDLFEKHLTCQTNSDDTRKKLHQSYLILIPTKVNRLDEKDPEKEKWGKIFSANFDENSLRCINDRLANIEKEKMNETISAFIQKYESQSTDSIPTKRTNGYNVLSNEISFGDGSEDDDDIELNVMSNISIEDFNTNKYQLTDLWIEGISINSFEFDGNIFENASELNRWKIQPLSLENPEMMNMYLKYLGVQNGDYEFVEIIGFEENRFNFDPESVLAVLLMFPITEEYESNRRKEFEEALRSPPDYPQSIYFLKQFVGNACGLIAVIHAIANNLEKFELDQHKPLAQFLNATKSMTSQQRSEHFKYILDTATVSDTVVEEEEFHDIDRVERADLHFVCFIKVNNDLYELDGRHPYPIKHQMQQKAGEVFDLLEITKDFVKSNETFNQRNQSSMFVLTKF